MELIGGNLIGGLSGTPGDVQFRATDPSTGMLLDPSFSEASAAEVDRAITEAEHAFRVYGQSSAEQRAQFLRAIAEEIIALGAPLLERAHAETGLPIGRLEGERARTVGQIRLFAEYLEEGSWVEARIDTGDAARAPAPKPDLRRMLVALGPVAVFGASNFPLAFSVAGGDTISALAAGCTVVFKAHPAHPGTSELVAGAVNRAANAAGIPSGVFSLLHGWSHEVGMSMVRHPLISAVGFTGSLRAGRAIFDAASARPNPIPVYAEMGSINPVFLLPSAVAERSSALAKGLAQSITMGVGQLCTNPGVIVGVRGIAFDQLASDLAEQIDQASAGVMLYGQLRESYTGAVERAGSRTEVLSRTGADVGGLRAHAVLLRTDGATFLADAALRDEMFGPVSVVVAASDYMELERVAEGLEGQLTATIHGTPDELHAHARLVEILTRKVGRLLFNGYPTGVEVGHAMQHGGPYPASSDSRTTSVGTAAMARFARPVCFQNFPEASLPVALRDINTLGIWRLVNGSLTRDDL